MLDEERASVHIGVLFEAGTTVMKLETCCKQHTPIVRGKNTTCIRRWESHVILPLHHQTLHKIEMMIMSWEKKKQPKVEKRKQTMLRPKPTGCRCQQVASFVAAVGGVAMASFNFPVGEADHKKNIRVLRQGLGAVVR